MQLLKRVFDFIASLIGLIILFPLLMVISLLIIWKLGPPIFFTQIRPGQHAKPFRMIKFRTMTNARDKEGNLLPNEKRMTVFGSFLRSTSLDELPELINVLKGDMSLVGPRPLLMDYIPYFTPKQNRRHEAKPGITGWSQVNGRNAIDWDRKLELDVWYVENWSFILDLKILWQTIFKVIKRDDINYDKEILMPRFDEYMINKKKE
ncbi:sugar transferase [soil metagenome]